MTQEQFKQTLASLTAQIHGRPLDTALEQWLNEQHGTTSALYQSLKQACQVVGEKFGHGME